MPSQRSADSASGFSLGDDVLLNTSQAAKLTGLSAKTLRQMRCDKQGPACFKFGKSAQARVVYRRTDIESWLRDNLVRLCGR